MPLNSVLRCAAFLGSLFALSVVVLNAQNSAPPLNSVATQPESAQPSGPAAIPMEEEQHHHLVFQNAYVKVFYVEIPPHESTLYHHHDLPYVSLPPPPLPDAAPSAPPRRRPPPSAHVSYALGGFSHTVRNTTDVTLRNIAVELLRPQGPARNRCAQIVRDQPLGGCDDLWVERGHTAVHHKTLFETDEITVTEFDFVADKIWPADEKLSTLVGGMSGIVNVTLNGDARAIPQAGLVWLLPGSKTSLVAGKDSPGHFVTIVFKDSALKQ